jgi:ribonuclease P protein component
MHAETPNLDAPGERAVFRRRHRLPSSTYTLVFDAKLRKSRGPITLHLRPNRLDEHRLGLSIGRRFGNAVRRSRFKRHMREVFRLSRAQLPTPSTGGAYDIVVTARGHDEASLGMYTSWFLECVLAAHRVHEKRNARAETGDA